MPERISLASAERRQLIGPRAALLHSVKVKLESVSLEQLL